MTIDDYKGIVDDTENDNSVDSIKGIIEDINNCLYALDTIDTAIYLAKYDKESKRKMRAYLEETSSRLTDIWNWMKAQNPLVDFKGNEVNMEG